MKERRAERMQENIRREVAMILAKERITPGIFATCTRVEISPDGLYANVYFVTVPRSADTQALLEFRKNIFSIQQALNKRLDIRPVPKLRFLIDRAEQEAAVIDEIIERL